jgi:hypothetical protein
VKRFKPEFSRCHVAVGQGLQKAIRSSISDHLPVRSTLEAMPDPKRLSTFNVRCAEIPAMSYFPGSEDNKAFLVGKGGYSFPIASDSRIGRA